MGFILTIVGHLVSLGKVTLDLLSFFKKAGKDECENERLKKEAAKDDKTIAELAKANEFILRLERDPAFRERVRNKLNAEDGTKDDGAGS